MDPLPFGGVSFEPNSGHVSRQPGVAAALPLGAGLPPARLSRTALTIRRRTSLV